LIPYAWVFPKWISGTKAKAEVKVAIWDDDGITGDDKAYICPKKNEKELWMDYDLATGAVSKDTSASASSTSPAITTSVHTKGNHGSGDEAEIWLTIRRWP